MSIAKQPGEQACGVKLDSVPNPTSFFTLQQFVVFGSIH
jgi:hypothetical protein